MSHRQEMPIIFATHLIRKCKRKDKSRRMEIKGQLKLEISYRPICFIGPLVKKHKLTS